MSDQPHQPLILVHDETGDEYTFTDRSSYLATFYAGGYSEKGDGEPSRTPPPAAAPRPAPAQPPQPVRPSGDN